MPKTIDSIVYSHMEAAKRRSEGLPIWDHKIRIKHLLHNKNSEPQEIGKAVATIIRSSTWWEKRGRDDDELRLLAEEIEEVDSVEAFDLVLDAIYDLADADRVWVS